MAKSEIKMKMSLDSSGVKTGLVKAKAGIANFANEANAKLGALAKMVSVGLAAAFVGFAKKAVDLGTTLSDIATSTNFATEEFQVFRGALIDAGGKAESMEKGINNMQKAIVQGGEGMTTYTRAFERLGLNVDKLRAMTPEEQFKIIAKATAEAEDQQGAYTSSMEIFGTKVAPRMQEVFKRLAKDGYQKMASDIEESYGIMDATTQASLDKAADSIERFKNKATIKVGELISGEANFAALKALGARAGQMLATVGEAIINTLLGGVKTVASALAAGFTVAFENLKKGFKLVGLELAKAITPVFNSLADLLSNIGIDIQKWNIDNIQNEIDKIQFDSPKERFKELKNEYKGAWDEAIPEINGASKAFGELAETYERQAKTAGVAREAIKKQKEEAQKLAAAQAQASAEMTEEYRLQQELQDALLRGDKEAAQLITDELDILKKIQQVKKQLGLNDEAARIHVETMIAKEKEQADAKKSQNAEKEAAEERLKQLQLDQLRAQADGNDDLATELQKRIDKEQDAIDLMDRFNLGLDEARRLAEKLAAVNAAPDGLDAFQIGGNIRNVSKDKRNRDLGAERAARAEKKIREAENREIGKRVRFGEDKADVMADINQRRAKRAGGGDPKVGGQPPNGGEPKVGGQPPNGPGDKKGPGPKKPEDPAKTTNKKLDEQIGLLKDIKDALKC